MFVQTAPPPVALIVNSSRVPSPPSKPESVVFVPCLKLKIGALPIGVSSTHIVSPPKLVPPHPPTVRVVAPCEHQPQARWRAWASAPPALKSPRNKTIFNTLITAPPKSGFQTPHPPSPVAASCGLHSPPCTFGMETALATDYS